MMDSEFQGNFDSGFDELVVPQLSRYGFTVAHVEFFKQSTPVFSTFSTLTLKNKFSDASKWVRKLLVQGQVNDITGQVHVVADHEYYANLPGQISASHPNTQAIPKLVRPFLVPPPGRELYSLDIGSAESRALVAVTGDRVLERAISSGMYEFVGANIQVVTGIKIPRATIKRITMAYFYGQTKFGLANMLVNEGIVAKETEAEPVYIAMQGTFQQTTDFLDQISASNHAFIQGHWTDIDVSSKSKAQRRSYVASSIIAQVMKRFSADLVRGSPEIYIHEIPRDGLYLSVPKETDPTQLLALGITYLKQALDELQYDSFPIADNKLLSINKIGEKS